jgi:hypothetical protein
VVTGAVASGSRCLEGPPESLLSGTSGMVPRVGGVAWVDGDERLFLLRR